MSEPEDYRKRNYGVMVEAIEVDIGNSFPYGLQSQNSRQITSARI